MLNLGAHRLTGRGLAIRWAGIQRARILIPLLVAVVLSVAPAHVQASTPYVIYTANNFADGAVILRTNPAAGSLVEVSRNGAQGNLFHRPFDVAVEANGNLVVVDMGVPNRKDGAVIRVDPVSGRQSLVSSGGSFYDPAGIAVGPGGVLYVVDNLAADNNGGVIRVDPRTGAQTLIASNNPVGLFDLPFGIAVDRDGSLVVVNRRTAGALPTTCLPSGNVIRVNPATGAQSLISAAGDLALPLGVAIGADRTIVVANECTGAAGLVGIPLLGAIQRILTYNNTADVLRTPERVAFDPDGNLLVSDYRLGADFDGGIVQVDPETQSQSVLQTGDLFNHPLGIAAVANRPPTAALAIARSAVAAGRRVTLDASGSRDPEGLRLVYEWDLDGDETFERGSGTTSTATPRFAVDGPKTVAVRVNDPHGGRAVAVGTLEVDGSLPMVTRLRSAARVLAVPARRKRARGSAARAARPPSSTSIRFRLSEAASVRLTVERARSGRRARGGPCRPKAKRGRRCTAWSRVRLIKRSGRAGENAIALRARGLTPGSFRVVLAAVDEVGNRSPRRTLALRVVRQAP